MRIGAAISYLVLVFLLAVLVGGREAPPLPALVATRGLEPNSLVLPGYLRPAETASPSALDGRYLGSGAPIAADGAAPVERFVVAPDLWPGERHLLLELPLPDRLEPHKANAGATLRLCHPALVTQQVALLVRALRCEAGARCRAVLELPPERAALAASALAAPQNATICDP
jgi:hypothetical protein